MSGSYAHNAMPLLTSRLRTSAKQFSFRPRRLAQRRGFGLPVDLGTIQVTMLASM